MQYSIGKKGLPWSATEHAAWLARQVRQRHYSSDVVSRLLRLAVRFNIEEYGTLDYWPDQYCLYAVRSRGWRDDLPIALVTGGVHGYETSGVRGALQFLEQRATDYAGRINILVVPCVSPWAYERINRWNANALDPNRWFQEDSPVEESAALLRLIAPMRGRFLVHIDLHETTDSDESELLTRGSRRD